jgi:predicted DsbA family dithiol-disulfide isomerase
MLGSPWIVTATADQQLAAALEVRSTPTLLINGMKIAGALPIEQLETGGQRVTKRDRLFA